MTEPPRCPPSFCTTWGAACITGFCTILLMKLWNIGEVQWGGVQSTHQERILDMSLVQNWRFIKAQGQDPWAERSAAPCCERWLIIYRGVRGGEEKGRLRKHFHMSKKTPRTLEAPPPTSQGCPHYHCVLINEL